MRDVTAERSEPAPPTRAAASRWIFRPRPEPHAASRLFCFPYAGGAAAVYRAWAPALAPEAEIASLQLPGRGASFRDPAIRDPRVLVSAATDAVEGLDDKPFAFFGHSMGALVAFEVTRELRRRGRRLPELLIVSGHQAPQVPDTEPPLGHLPDREFIEEIQARYEGIPPEVLAEPELLEILLPALRADVAVLESHVYVDEAPLACPIVGLAGEHDRRPREEYEAWRAQTSGGFDLHFFRGGHFFIDIERESVWAVIRESLRGIGRG